MEYISVCTRMRRNAAEWNLFLCVCECGGMRQNGVYFCVYANAAECGEMKLTSVNTKKKEAI